RSRSSEEFQQLKYYQDKKWRSLKQNKQSILNAKDYKKELFGKFGNREVREWYIHQDKNIINMIDKTKSIKDQAFQAYSLRNKYKPEARLMMNDREAAEALNKADKNLSFDELVQNKMKRKNLTKEQAYKDVINTAGKTNKKVNERLNLE